jgi:RNA polymerase sigma factor (sigma-70 family)
MKATQDHEQPDEYLAVQAATGDQAAFAALYERYFDGTYDLALRTVRHPDVAVDVVQSTFTKAWDGIRKGKAGQNLKVWLFTSARKNAIDRMPRSHRPVSGTTPREFIGRPPPFSQLDASISPRVQAALEDEELVEIVWNSAAVLSPKQYSLLDLHLRRRITADELAKGLGVTKSNVYTMLSRLRGALAESVTYTLLLRRGGAECRELGYLLSQMQETAYTRETRRVLKDHVKNCNQCQASKRQQVSPLDIFAGLVLVPAAPGVKGSIWQRISSHIKGVAVPRDRLVRDRPVHERALPAPAINVNPRIAAAIGGVIALVVVLVLATFLLTSGGSTGANAPDPSDVRSTDREVGEPSSDNTIEMEWSAVPGVKGYSISWSEEPQELPDTEPDLPGTATGTTSPRLDPGTWYFHLRTQGENDRWTSTVHAGPFEITDDEGDATPRPTQTPAPGSPSPTATPVPVPRFPTAPPAPATPEPTPPPTEPPTPEPTAPPITPPPVTPPPATPSPAPATATPAPTP